jgi:IS5 family transposase
MTKKITYRVRNWPEYNRSLINRGNLTIWFDEASLEQWACYGRNGKKGRDQTYSDHAIECALTIRSLFNLTLRKTQGFLKGMKTSMALAIEIPDYTTLSRRAGRLKINLGNIKWDRPVNIVIDATGLKVYGEGEWKMRIHGKSKRRTWRKMHVAIDRETQEIASISLTESNVHDSMETKNLLSELSNIATVTGDKGYDNKNAYDPIAAKGAHAIIPVRSGAALKKKNISWGDVERNRIVKETHCLGKDAWKYGTGYTRRVLVETAIGRYKQTLGARLHAKKLANQQT